MIPKSGFVKVHSAPVGDPLFVIGWAGGAKKQSFDARDTKKAKF